MAQEKGIGLDLPKEWNKEVDQQLLSYGSVEGLESRKVIVQERAQKLAEDKFTSEGQKKPKPQSAIAKIQEDIRNNIISSEQGGQAIENITGANEKVKKREITKIKDSSSVKSFFDSVNIAVSEIEELENDPNLSFATGASGLLTGFGTLPGNSRVIAKKLDTIRAKAAFETLSEMRRNSKTGGALGNVSEKELKLLESSIGALDMGMTDKVFRTQLSKIKKRFLNIRKNATMGFKNLYKEDFQETSRQTLREQEVVAPSSQQKPVIRRKFNIQTGRIE